MTPKDPPEVFPYIIHFIFAIVIANSYVTAKQVFVDSWPLLLHNYDVLAHILGLVVVYIIIISGWIGYSRSLIKWPYKDTKLSVYRFILDFAVLFCYFVLVNIIEVIGDFELYLSAWIVILFTCFVLWDILKLIENKKIGDKDNIRRMNRSLAITVIFFVISSIFLIIYHTFDVIFIVLIAVELLIVLGFRYYKWPIVKKGKPS